MINLPTRSRIWLAAGITDMRKSFQGLAAQVESQLKEAALSGQLFMFRGRRGNLLKVLWATNDGLCLLSKRLERCFFVWPVSREGKIFLTQGQLALLLERLEVTPPSYKHWSLSIRLPLLLCDNHLLENRYRPNWPEKYRH
jgi:transposase